MDGRILLLTQWFLDLVSVLETEYGSDQNDLIRHVTDSVVLRFVLVSAYWLASKTLPGVYRFEFLRCIFVCENMCHNSSACHVYVMWVELGHSHKQCGQSCVS